MMINQFLDQNMFVFFRLHVDLTRKAIIIRQVATGGAAHTLQICQKVHFYRKNRVFVGGLRV